MSAKEFLFEEFQSLVSELLGMEKEIIKKEAIIYQDIGIDSLGLVNLGVKIEKQLEISLPAAETVDVKTVGEFFELVKKLVDAKA
jgi:acyl carrier protein